MTTNDLDGLAQLDDLPQAEATALAAKSAYAADPSPANRDARRDALTALREARWRVRGGLDNPYGARSYDAFLFAARAQTRANRYVTLDYADDGTVTVHYGDWIVVAEPAVTGEGDE